MPFLDAFSFVLPIDAEGNANLDENDIMRAFFIVTLVISGLAEIARVFGRRLRPDEVASRVTACGSVLRGLKLPLILITIFFGAAMLVLPFANRAEGTSQFAFYAIVLFFYFASIVSTIIYRVAVNISDSLLSWVGAQLGAESAWGTQSLQTSRFE